MEIYFACSITGGRQDEAVYQAIVAHLLEQGHRVPTAVLADPDVLDLEALADPLDVYQRDTAWIAGCDALVAEVSTPSHGVGYEIGYALAAGKPVLCCYRENATVSKMILGNPHPLLQLVPYDSPQEAVQVVDAFLQKVFES